MSNKTLLNILAAFAESTGDVVDNTLALGVVEDLAEELTSLLVVIVRVIVSVAADLTVVGGSVPGGMLSNSDGASGVRVRSVILSRAEVSIDAHGTITLVGVNTGSVGAVNGDLFVVGSESMSVSIRVREKTSLEHLVERGLDSGNQVRRRESGLFGFSMEVLGVAVKSKLTDINQGVVFVRPDLGYIIDIESILGSISNGHDLNLEVPSGEVFFGNVIEKIVSSKVFIGGDLSGCLFGSKALDSLISLEVILDKEFFLFVVNPLEGVRRVSVHVSESIGSSTIRHKNGDLMECFGRVGPEVKLHVGIVSSLLGARLLRVDEVRELDGVLDEEHGGVVTDHIVVAFFSVEFNGKSTGVSYSIGSTSFSSNSRETEEARSALLLGGEESSLSELGNIRVGNFKESMSSSSLGVNNSLRNSLSIERSELVN